MSVILTDAEAALFHALLLNIAQDAEAMGNHRMQLRTIAGRLHPSPDLPEPNRSSHQS